MSEDNLSAVTSEKEPKQDKEALRARWAWVEHGMWTDAMLRTLERGIKGGKWFALIDKVYGIKNLQSSFWKVWRNAGSAGIDGQSVQSFEAKEEQELQGLAEELRTGRYRRTGKEVAAQEKPQPTEGKASNVYPAKQRTEPGLHQGRARGKDHQRWRNRFFDEVGLFNLTAARQPANSA
jgi:hypothetical protein